MGDSRVASPILYEGQRRLALRHRSGAIRAAAAGVGGFSLLAVLVYIADEHPAFKAGAGTL